MNNSLIITFNNSASDTTTLSLHDALPIYGYDALPPAGRRPVAVPPGAVALVAVEVDPEAGVRHAVVRSEEHTSELQSRRDLVCRLLIEKKKKKLIHTGSPQST